MRQLTFGLSRDLRLEPLIDGTVKPQNIELEFVFSSPTELHYRNLKFNEFDLFQMSISEFLIVKDMEETSKWHWTGLPVFFSKAFGWLNLFVNSGTKITHLGDLKGKRVGIPDYPMTGALWMRIFLKEFYGIVPGDIDWYIGRTKDVSHGALLGLDRNPPPGVHLTWLTEKQTLDRMLDNGELDAAYGFPVRREIGVSEFRTIDRYGGTVLTGNPRLRKLFLDGGRQVINEYYAKTAILPANHMFAIQNSILDEHPWVAIELYKAFQKSKEAAYDRAKRLSSTYLLFEGEDYANQDQLFGEDPYPLGVKENRKMLETLFRGSHEEGLTKTLPLMERIFIAGL